MLAVGCSGKKKSNPFFLLALTGNTVETTETGIELPGATDVGLPVADVPPAEDEVAVPDDLTDEDETTDVEIIVEDDEVIVVDDGQTPCYVKQRRFYFRHPLHHRYEFHVIKYNERKKLKKCKHKTKKK